MNKKSIITILLAIVVVVGLAQEVHPVQENALRIVQALEAHDVKPILALLTEDCDVEHTGAGHAELVLSTIAAKAHADSYEVASVTQQDSLITVVINAIKHGQTLPLTFVGRTDGRICAIWGMANVKIETREESVPLSLSVVAARDSVTVPFDLKNGNIVLHIEADGKPLTMIFDTGCNVTMFNLAYHGKRQTNERSFTQTAGIVGGSDKRQMEDVKFDSLRIGENIYAIETLAQDLTALEQGEGYEHLDGLLGCDFVQDLGFEVHIDYPAQTLTFYRLNEKGESTCKQQPKMLFPFELVDNYLPLLTFSVDGVNLKLVFDTGCEIFNLSPSAFDKLPQRYESSGQVQVSDLHDMKSVSQVNIDSIAMGSIEKRGVLAIIMEQALSSDGMIGASFFRDQHISLNYRTKTLCVY